MQKNNNFLLVFALRISKERTRELANSNPHSNIRLTKTKKKFEDRRQKIFGLPSLQQNINGYLEKCTGF